MTLSTDPKKVKKARKYIKSNLGAIPIGKPISGTQSFAIPRGSSSISEIFMMIEKNTKKFKILDWGISNSSF